MNIQPDDPKWTAYVLGGSLLLFEIVNQTNGWVVTSRRGITLRGIE